MVTVNASEFVTDLLVVQEWPSSTPTLPSSIRQFGRSVGYVPRAPLCAPSTPCTHTHAHAHAPTPCMLSTPTPCLFFLHRTPCMFLPHCARMHPSRCHDRLTNPGVPQYSGLLCSLVSLVPRAAYAIRLSNADPWVQRGSYRLELAVGGASL
jgi:hypothetical protein